MIIDIARNPLEGCLASALLLGAAAFHAPGATLNDALDAPGLAWTTGGDAPWYAESQVTHDGVGAARSGALSQAYQQSWLQTSVTGTVAVVFWWKLSSDPTWSDYGLETNNNGAASLTGEADWQLGAVEFASGTNSLVWNYQPHVNPNGEHLFAAWLDQVLVTNVVGLAPVILAQPPTTVTLPDNYHTNAVLCTVAIGEPPLSWQWLFNGTNAPSTYPYIGVNDATLTIASPSSGQVGDYQVVVSNAWGSATSTVSRLNVTPAIPFIWPGQPPDCTLASGSWYWLGVAPIYGTPPFGYQWFKDGAPLTGVTNTYFNIMNASAGDTGGYQVVVTNPYGAVTSRVAQIIVSTALPTVNQVAPQVVDAQPGDDVEFDVDASGPQPLGYTWLKDGSPLPDQVNSNYEDLPSVTPDDAGLYQAVVSNPNGSVTSQVCVLGVEPVSPLAVALEAPQLLVTNMPDGGPWGPDVAGTNAHNGLCAARSSSVDNGSSSFSAAVSGPAEVTFWWRVFGDAATSLDLMMDGNPGKSISGETPWLQGDVLVPYGDHLLTWTYHREGLIDNVDGNGGWVDELSVGPPPSGFTPPVILAQPEGLAVAVGEAFELSVTVSGTAPLFYQWYKNDAPLIGATNATYDGIADVPDSANTYYVVIWNLMGQVRSGNLVLSLTAPPVITQQPVGCTVYAGAAVVLTVTASNTISLPPWYQWCSNGVAIPGANGRDLVLTNLSLAQAGGYSVLVMLFSGFERGEHERPGPGASATDDALFSGGSDGLEFSSVGPRRDGQRLGVTGGRDAPGGRGV